MGDDTNSQAGELATNAQQTNDSDDDCLREGSVLSASWLVGQVLGSGGMATVYSVTGLDGRGAALKIMHKRLLHQPGALHRFLREGLIGTRLHHHGIVRCFDQGTTDEALPYIVLERLEGVELSRVYRQPNVAPGALVRLFLKVLEVLAYCHENDVIHRDIKPANIYVLPCGRVKILDFGLARANNLGPDFMKNGVSIGTPSYMSPEQAMGAWEHVDERADVFAVGASMFAALSGTRLHKAKTEAKSCDLAASRAAPSLRTVAPHLDDQLIAFVDRALSWDMFARFKNARQMHDELAAFAERIDPNAPLPYPNPKLKISDTSDKQATSSDDQQIDKLRPTFDDPVLDACSQGFYLLAKANHESTEPCAKHALFCDSVAHFNTALEFGDSGLQFRISPWNVRMDGHVLWHVDEPMQRCLYRMFDASVRTVHFSPATQPEELRTWLQQFLPPYPTGNCADFANNWFVEEHGSPRLGLALFRLAGTRVVSASDTTPPVSEQTKPTARPSQAPSLRVSQPPLSGSRTSTPPASSPRWSDRPSGTFDSVSPLTRYSLIYEPFEPVTKALVPPDLAMLLASPHGGRHLGPASVSAALTDTQGDAHRAFAATVIGVIRSGAPNEEREKLLHAVARGLAQDGAFLKLLTILDGLGNANFHVEKPIDFEIWKSIVRIVDNASQAHSADTTVELSMLSNALMVSGACSTDTCIDALASAKSLSVRQVLSAHLRSQLANNVQIIAGRLADLDAQTGYELVQSIGALQSEAATQELQKLAQSPDTPLGLLALAQLEPHATVAQTVITALDSPNSQLRRAALRLIVDQQIYEAIDPLADKISSDAFAQYPAFERTLAMETLAIMAPEPAQVIAQNLVIKHRLLFDDPIDDTRDLAVLFLQKHGNTEDTITALRAAHVPMWWNPPSLRLLAQQAIEQVEQRIQNSQAVFSAVDPANTICWYEPESGPNDSTQGVNATFTSKVGASDDIGNVANALDTSADTNKDSIPAARLNDDALSDGPNIVEKAPTNLATEAPSIDAIHAMIAQFLVGLSEVINNLRHLDKDTSDEETRLAQRRRYIEPACAHAYEGVTRYMQALRDPCCVQFDGSDVFVQGLALRAARWVYDAIGPLCHRCNEIGLRSIELRAGFFAHDVFILAQKIAGESADKPDVLGGDDTQNLLGNYNSNDGNYGEEVGNGEFTQPVHRSPMELEFDKDATDPVIYELNEESSKDVIDTAYAALRSVLARIFSVPDGQLNGHLHSNAHSTNEPNSNENAKHIVQQGKALMADGCQRAYIIRAAQLIVSLAGTPQGQLPLPLAHQDPQETLIDEVRDASLLALRMYRNICKTTLDLHEFAISILLGYQVSIAEGHDLRATSSTPSDLDSALGNDTPDQVNGSESARFEALSARLLTTAVNMFGTSNPWAAVWASELAWTRGYDPGATSDVSPQTTVPESLSSRRWQSVAALIAGTAVRFYKLLGRHSDVPGAITILRNECKTVWDEAVLRLLLVQLGALPKDCVVRLSTNEIALVLATVTGADALHPQIEQFIDAHGNELEPHYIVDLVDEVEITGKDRRVSQVIALHQNYVADLEKLQRSARSVEGPEIYVQEWQGQWLDIDAPDSKEPDSVVSSKPSSAPTGAAGSDGLKSTKKKRKKSAKMANKYKGKGSGKSASKDTGKNKSLDSVSGLLDGDFYETLLADLSDTK